MHYGPGQTYKPHFDSFDPGSPFITEDPDNFGQRTTTVLVYLTERFEGGHTAFPRLNWRFRGRTGDALFWRNLLPDGSRDEATLHGGLPPTSGEKWIISQWVRDQPQPLFG